MLEEKGALTGTHFTNLKRWEKSPGSGALRLRTRGLGVASDAARHQALPARHYSSLRIGGALSFRSTGRPLSFDVEIDKRWVSGREELQNIGKGNLGLQPDRLLDSVASLFDAAEMSATCREDTVGVWPIGPVSDTSPCPTRGFLEALATGTKGRDFWLTPAEATRWWPK
jgi:hypothetical protein